MSTTLKRTEEKIERIKRELQKLGPMRPGSITRQYRLPKERKRPFYQLSYTYRMRSHTEYVRPENLPTLRRETNAFRKFRKLAERLVSLSLQASKLRLAQVDSTRR
jgi:hypothetical protein